MAIPALLEGQWLGEISISVALGAVHADVLAFERKFGLRVIEPLIHGLDRDFLPACRVMTRLAAVRELSVVRVLVAVGALVKRNFDIPRLAIHAIRMALGTFNLHMQPRERIACFRVIELPDIDRLPILEVVAGLTSRAQAAFVLILVTSGTSRRKTEVSAIGIFDFDGGPFLRRDARGIVALVASQSCVLAFEYVPCLFVVERFDVPLHQREIFSVMLGVAAGAFVAGTRRNVVGGVQAASA